MYTNIGNFTPMTQNMQRQMGTNANIYSGIQQSFEQNPQLIPLDNTQNKNNTLHNNLADNLLTERITEYRIQINSRDRDTNKFPSPFDIQVSFGNSNSSLKIDRPFLNVKYVTINSVITPRTLAIDTSNIYPNTTIPTPTPAYTGDIYPTKSHVYSNALSNTVDANDMTNHPFFYLKIPQLSSGRSMSTSSLLDDNVFMLVQDQYLRDMCLWKPRRQTVTYFNSSLSNLNALSLRIVDAQGQALTFYDQVGTPIIGKPLGSRVTMDYNAYIAANTDTNASVRYTNTVMQVMYDISIGVSENELATRVQYR